MSAYGAHWDLLRLLVVREVRVRYARAALGMAWAVLLPVVMLLIFSSVPLSDMLADTPYAGTPYPVFAFTGLIFWMNFQQSVLHGTSALAVAHDILHKSRFPAELIPVSRILAWLLDLGIGLVLLVVLMIGHGADWHATALLVPVIFLVQMIFTVGLSLLTSALNLFFRDVHYMLTALMPLMMLASNVAWPLDNVEGVKGEILRLNPIVSYLDAYRHVVFLGELPTLRTCLPGLIGAAAVLFVGLAYFRRVRPRFAEEV